MQPGEAGGAARARLQSLSRICLWNYSVAVATCIKNNATEKGGFASIRTAPIGSIIGIRDQPQKLSPYPNTLSKVATFELAYLTRYLHWCPPRPPLLKFSETKRQTFSKDLELCC